MQVVDGEVWGTLSISTHRVEDVAFKIELQRDGSVRFVIVQEEEEVSFNGRLEDGVITGGFRIGLIGGKFRLERVEVTATPTVVPTE